MTIRMLDPKTYRSASKASGAVSARKNGRVERKDIERLVTARYLVALTENQYFCETAKAYEIWEGDSLPYRVKRIPKTSVLWVIEK